MNAPEETPKPIPLRLTDLLGEWERDAAHAHDCYTSGRPRGPVTALPKLDGILGGYLIPGVHVIHGNPGSGKTALALQIAGTCGCPAVYVTCEMSPLELLHRTAARVTGTSIDVIKGGELSPAASLELARRAIDATPDLWILDATACYPFPADIQETARLVRGDALHVLVVIDSVHSWAQGIDTDGASEYDTLNRHLNGLNALAKALRIPVLAVAERNRYSMETGGQSASAGTRRFEYGGSSILELHKKKGVQGNLATREIPIQCDISKNRNGQEGKDVMLQFNKKTLTFREDE